MTTSQDLQSLCDALDAALTGGDFAPEDISRIMKILEPLEEAVADLPAPPERGSSAGRIAQLLWGKRHQTPSPTMLASLQDEEPFIRATAVDALADVLRNRRLDVAMTRRAQAIVQDQIAVERSPIISYRLRELQDRLRELASTRPRRSTRKDRANPYIAGLPVRGRDRFFGREEILAAIRETFREGGARNTVIVHGARRTGKTSLLLKIQDGALGERFLPIYLDLQTIGGLEPRRFLWWLTMRVSAALDDRDIHVRGVPESAEGSEPISLVDFFRDVVEKVAPHTVILLADEYEVLEQYFKTTDIARQFQALFEREPSLCWVFAGSRKVETLGYSGALFPLDVARYIKISFLKPHEARELITLPSQGVLVFEPAAVDEMLILSGGHPFYAQLLGELVFDLTSSQARVAPSDVEQAVQKFVRDPSPHVILTWNALGFTERVAGAIAASVIERPGGTFTPEAIVDRLKEIKFPLAIHPGQIRRALEVLREIDWVDKETGVETYRFTMDLVRRWIAENRSIWGLLDEHRASILARLPRTLRHACAWPVDLILLVLLSVPIIQYVTALPKPPLWLLALSLVSMALTTAYFLLSVPLARGTVGMLLCGLRVLRVSGDPVRGWRAVLFALLLQTRLYIWLAAGLVVGLWIELVTLRSAVAFCVGLLVATEVVDLVMMWRGARKQGLYERIAGLALVRDAPVS